MFRSLSLPQGMNNEGIRMPTDSRSSFLSIRQDWMDLLRFVSVFGIIMIHVSAICWYDYPVSSFNWKCLNFWNGVNRFCLPCLVMISGALLLSPEKNMDPGSIWKRRIPRILIAWVVWSLIYASTDLIKFFLSGDHELLSEFVRSLLRGHFHLWYLAMLIGLYICLPLLRPIAANKTLLRYFLLLSFGVSSLMPSISALFPALRLDEWAGRLYLFLPLGYVFYFTLGYYLVSEEIQGKTLVILYASGFLSLTLIIVGTYLGNLDPPGIGEMLYQNLHVLGAVSAAGVFVFFKNRIGKRPFPRPLLSFLSKAARYSFGIYLVHELVSILLPHLGITVSMAPAILTVPLISVFIYSISFLITAVLHRIPLINRYMV